MAAAGAMVVAAGVLFLARQVRSLDLEVLERLILAFDMQQMESDTGAEALYTWPVVLLTTGFALAASWSGYRLPAVPRLIVLVQLFVLTILCQWALWSWWSIPSSPLSYFGAVFAGCLAGYLVRTDSLRERRSQSQYYELLLRNRELQETKLQLVKQDEVERRMLAADLHDQVLNDLKVLKQKIESYAESPDNEKARQINELLQQAMSEIREVMDSLCPSALEHLGLAAAVEDCLRRGAERGGFKGRLKNRLDNGDLENLSMVEQSLLYRLVQESITNVLKHARASTVRASLEKSEGDLVIRIADDGKGIDPAALREDSRGVRYMRQRADLIGAKISWGSGDGGKGTTVEIRMSLSGRGDG